MSTWPLMRSSRRWKPTSCTTTQWSCSPQTMAGPSATGPPTSLCGGRRARRSRAAPGCQRSCWLLNTFFLGHSNSLPAVSWFISRTGCRPCSRWPAMMATPLEISSWTAWTSPRLSSPASPPGRRWSTTSRPARWREPTGRALTRSSSARNSTSRAGTTRTTRHSSAAGWSKTRRQRGRRNLEDWKKIKRPEGKVVS